MSQDVDGRSKKCCKSPQSAMPGSSSVRSAVVVGVLIAIIPAVLGYFASFLDGIRKDQLAFTNQQIEKLYGPLYALTQADNVTWKQFTESLTGNDNAMIENRPALTFPGLEAHPRPPAETKQFQQFR